MARYTGPSCRLCRADGMKLFLKGAKCTTDKCPVAKRQVAPGQHGRLRKKESNYGLQLREKQRVKRIYGMLEKQFRHFFAIAERSKGVTGLTLLELLERRLDNVLFRLCYATSRNQARQIVKHGSVYVNSRRVDIPSYLVKPGDALEVKGKEAKLKAIKETREELKDRAIPKWLEPETENLRCKVTALPTKEDVGFPIQEQLIVELYSK